MSIFHDRPGKYTDSLFNRAVLTLEQARLNIVRTVNSQMVIAYWLIGREIVEDEQHGKARAEYGKRVIEDLSRHLTERYGKGFSVSNLWSFRQFYIVYGDRRPEIFHPMGRELKREKKLHPTGGESPLAGKGRPMGDELQDPKRYPLGHESATGFHPDLSWSHYVNYYDREVCTAVDNPTIGLILCTDKNDAVVRYVLDEANRQIFASRYRLELPSTLSQ